MWRSGIALSQTETGIMLKEFALMICGVLLAILLSLLFIWILGGAEGAAIPMGFVAGVIVAVLIIRRGAWWMIGVALLTPPWFFWGLYVLGLKAAPTEPFYGPTLPWFLAMTLAGAAICMIEAAYRGDAEEEHH